MKKATDYLFVYGTLLSEIPSSMSKFLRRRGELVGKGRIKGELIDLGGYPGLLLKDEGFVRGELYRIREDRAAETWQLLDAYEGVTDTPGEDYRKTEVEVRVENGGKFPALTYEFVGKAAGRSVIPNGNYPPFYRQNPEHLKFTGND